MSCNRVLIYNYALLMAPQSKAQLQTLGSRKLINEPINETISNSLSHLLKDSLAMPVGSRWSGTSYHLFFSLLWYGNSHEFHTNRKYSCRLRTFKQLHSFWQAANTARCEYACVGGRRWRYHVHTCVMHMYEYALLLCAETNASSTHCKVHDIKKGVNCWLSIALWLVSGIWQRLFYK